MVDFHGSTGYGQAFTDAINGDWGGAPYEDLMKGLDFALAKYPFLDGTGWRALGASYGGYMINWIAGHTDRFKCLVCHDGNLDERMAYFDTEELWFPEWEHGGPPWENPEDYTKHSPDRVRGELEDAHAGDPRGQGLPGRVHAGALDVQPLCSGKGIPSKLLVLPGREPLGAKPANSIQWHETVLGWLDQWCKTKP